MPAADRTKFLVEFGRGVRKRKAASLFVSLILMALIFAVLIHLGGWEALIDALSNARPAYIAAAIVLHLLVIFGGTPFFWQRIVVWLGARPPIAEIYRLWLGVLCLRVILPMKAGSFVVGPHYLLRHYGLPFARGAGSMAMYHFINFYTIWVYLALGLWITGAAGYWIPAFLSAGIASVPFVLPWMRHPVAWVRARNERVGDLFANLVAGFTDIGLSHRLTLIAAGCVLQLVDLLAIGMCLGAAGISVPLGDLLWRAPLVMLSAKLPITFLGLGTREAATVAFFASFGSEAAALAGGLIVSFSMRLLPVFLSMLFLPGALRMGLFAPVADAANADRIGANAS
ncbi:flippase-like domain-containing protein [bacterium]|nr:flippase-like domain-containing protein [bacterium]